MRLKLYTKYFESVFEMVMRSYSHGSNPRAAWNYTDRIKMKSFGKSALKKSV